MRIHHQIRLIAEILVVYVRLLRLLRTNDLELMVEGARCPPERQVPYDGDHHEAARRLGFIVRKVLGVLPTDKRCLIRSLVLVRLLSERAIEAKVVIGVLVEDGFKAHAWVEHQDRAVLPAGGYERLLEL